MFSQPGSSIKAGARAHSLVCHLVGGYALWRYVGAVAVGQRFKVNLERS